MGVVSEEFVALCGTDDPLWTSVILDSKGRKKGIVGYGMVLRSTGEAYIAKNMARYTGGEKPVVQSAEKPMMKNADLAVRLGMYGKAAQFLAKAGPDGEKALERLNERGKTMLEAAQGYETEDPYLAWRLAGVVGREFRKTDLGPKARKLASKLARSKEVKNERKADAALAKILAAGRKVDAKTRRMMLTQLALKLTDTRGGRIAQRTLKLAERRKNEDE
jgi:hypothetical protein